MKFEAVRERWAGGELSQAEAPPFDGQAASGT